MNKYKVLAISVRELKKSYKHIEINTYVRAENLEKAQAEVNQLFVEKYGVEPEEIQVSLAKRGV